MIIVQICDPSHSYVYYHTFIKPQMQLSMMQEILKAILNLDQDMQTQLYNQLGVIIEEKT